jgi:uncharacterized protein
MFVALPAWSQLGLHVIAKPIGPICNLRCDYCFYLEKESLYPEGERWRMSDETLEAFVRQYIEAQPEAVDEIDFAFQGGEPTLLGIDFFRRVLKLQEEHARAGMRIHNSLQTNGVLLDDRWCEFLAEHDFLVGLSIDGPINLHDDYRRDQQGRGTFYRVSRALRRLFRHGVAFNALTCVHRGNADHAVRVYRFLRDAGIQFIQLIPVVRPLEDPSAGEPAKDARPEELVRPPSVLPEQYGRFLVEVFDEWVYQDVGRVFVRDFEQALAAWLGVTPALCVYTRHCGRAAALEHNGDLYRCDHFVGPPHKLGNIHQTPIKELVNSAGQEQFGLDKERGLPEVCRRCGYLFFCRGGCPKDRFLRTPDGQPGLNYLCRGYKMFCEHIDPYMKAMAAEVQAGRPAAGVMYQLRARRQQGLDEAVTVGLVRRNDPCPCGSGRKYKSCCLRR